MSNLKLKIRAPRIGDYLAGPAKKLAVYQPKDNLGHFKSGLLLNEIPGSLCVN